MFSINSTDIKQGRRKNQNLAFENINPGDSVFSVMSNTSSTKSIVISPRPKSAANHCKISAPRLEPAKFLCGDFINFSKKYPMKKNPNCPKTQTIAANNPNKASPTKPGRKKRSKKHKTQPVRHFSEVGFFPIKYEENFQKIFKQFC
jgi:hypothetical protein